MLFKEQVVEFLDFVEGTDTRGLIVVVNVQLRDGERHEGQVNYRGLERPEPSRYFPGFALSTRDGSVFVAYDEVDEIGWRLT